MSYICYECFITPGSGGADTALADNKLILCPRDPHYRVVRETRLRCLCCGNSVLVDLHVRHCYAAAEPGAGGPQYPLAA